MLCCLIAKKAGNCHTIARIRNPEYHGEVDFIKEELGLSMYLNPERASATEISRLLKFPSAIEVDTFVKGRVELLKIEIPENSILVGKKIMEISKTLQTKVFVCTVQRENEVSIPGGNFTLLKGDRISIIAEPKDMDVFFHKIGINDTRIRKVMIVGGGMIAFYLAEILIKSGIYVTIIENDIERCRELAEKLPDAMIINGDGTDESILDEESIASMDAFVALTNMDEENIMLSIYAKTVYKAKTISKINHMTFTDILNKLDVGSVICPKDIAGEYILRYVRAMQNSVGSNVETLYKIVDGKAEALEFHARNDSVVIGIKLSELNTKDNVLIACINRKGRIFTPGGSDAIQVGDTVIVVTTQSGLNDLSDIVKQG